jgi:hypothetical protein
VGGKKHRAVRRRLHPAEAGIHACAHHHSQVDAERIPGSARQSPLDSHVAHDRPRQGRFRATGQVATSLQKGVNKMCCKLLELLTTTTVAK